MIPPHTRHFHIDGSWVEPLSTESFTLVDPATETGVCDIASAGVADVDRAVSAARRAFGSYSRTSLRDRTALLERVRAAYVRREVELAEAITREMGATAACARAYQVPLGREHLDTVLREIGRFPFETREDDMILRREPVGVCALITPWNWPLNQIVSKVAPALATGCTMVLKPSECSPLSALIFAEIVAEAGVPAGVFNLINGAGPTGAALAAHPGVDMVSITGSTRAGIAVAKAAADTVKRVAQELGGKSANLILDDGDVARAVAEGIDHCFVNAGQSCNAPTRFLVPNGRLDEAKAAAREAARATRVDAPANPGDHMGPVVNRTQFERIRELVRSGLEEGATLVAGGAERPEGREVGFYIRPTVFADVTPDMRIWREEIFGPVVCLTGYADEDEAVRLANDTVYGLAAYVTGGAPERSLDIARRLRAGQVAIDYVGGTTATPFGGYGQSGNGREKGRWGLEEFTELKAITGAIGTSG